MSNSVIRNQKAKLAADYNDLLKELSSPKLKSIGCYTLGETIGRGSYGKVKLGVHQLTCRLVAIKKISKRHAPLMAREIHHHRQLHHPNIVSLYEILSTETSIFIVSEHCPHGDLFDALAKKGRFSEPHARRWFLQLIDAIQYCHSLGIIHRDLKLENILIDENDNVKICDFGFARQTDKNQLLKTFCGSLAYSAPEVIQRQNYSGPATDIWSLGVILHTLLAGELPFDDDSESELQRKVVKMDYVIPSYFSSDVADLIQKILKLDPYDRYTVPQIRCHPWLLDAATTINSPTQPLSTLSGQQQKLHEQDTANALLNAGFDTSVVREMRLNHFGMLGTLWTMLLLKSSHAINVTSEKALLPKATCTTTQTGQEEDGWIDSFKSWFISKPTHNATSRCKPIQPAITLTLDEKRLPGAVQQHKFMMKTMVAPPIITTTIPILHQDSHSNHNCTPREQKYPALKPTVLPLTPIHPTTPTKEDDELIINTSSTCSSAADDDYDDDDQMSVASSPATSVAEDDDDEDVEDKVISRAECAEPNADCNMTAFHRVSPMVSGAEQDGVSMNVLY
ncbi:kinase-like domain-containing protein [Mucor lusitanicus]|uniref:Kinase-like domain-containing protein n=2 Tax=Mucor circinelloides f. lusitanicus TaxID=29924 RepID=A0A8H4BCK4_MUCCL|nr:kinase-like domain-containing protein [Mucor lusitanicus]